MGLRASQEGLLILEQARRNKRWTKSSMMWCKAACVSQPTLKRLWQRKTIRSDNFVAICRAAGCDWLDVAEAQSDDSDRCYIHRPPVESLCQSEIRKPGALIRIKAPKGMGKTSLISKISDYVHQKGYALLRLNMLQLDIAEISDLDKVLRWVCRNAHRRLNLSPCHQVEKTWKDEYGSNDNCTAYFEDRLLGQLEHPLVLILDNLDRIFPFEGVAQDFLGLLRSWHEEARHGEIWKQLRIILAHSTDLYPTLRVEHSPFNVGAAIELPEFTIDQVSEFLTWYKIVLSDLERKELMDLIGGHPELLSIAVFYRKLHPSQPFQDFLRVALTKSSPFHNHLQSLHQQLQQNSGLAAAMQKLVAAQDPILISDRETFHLCSLGVTYLQDNQSIIRNSLYRNYFSARL